MFATKSMLKVRFKYEMTIEMTIYIFIRMYSKLKKNYVK